MTVEGKKKKKKTGGKKAKAEAPKATPKGGPRKAKAAPDVNVATREAPAVAPVISNAPFEDLEMTVNLSGDHFRLPGRDDLEGPTQTFLPEDVHHALRARAPAENGAPHAHDDAPAGDDSDDFEDAETIALPGRDVATSHLKGLLEALVFVADGPMKTGELARAASAPVKEVRPLMDELRAEYSLRGIHLEEVAGGWVFRTAAVYAPFVRDATGKRPIRLSRAQVETLAIVAYRQPITRPEVDEIRGVDCGPVLKLLLERDLVRILGKKDEPGRPILYGTTAEFLELFGLKSLKDLPTLKEFTDLSDDSRRVYEDETGEDAEDAVTRTRAAAEAEPVAPAEDRSVGDAALSQQAEGEDAPSTEEPEHPAHETHQSAPPPAPGGEESSDDDEFAEDYDDDDFEDDDDEDDDEDEDDDDEGSP